MTAVVAQCFVPWLLVPWNSAPTSGPVASCSHIPPVFSGDSSPMRGRSLTMSYSASGEAAMTRDTSMSLMSSPSPHVPSRPSTARAVVVAIHSSTASRCTVVVEEEQRDAVVGERRDRHRAWSTESSARARPARPAVRRRRARRRGGGGRPRRPRGRGRVRRVPRRGTRRMSPQRSTIRRVIIAGTRARATGPSSVGMVIAISPTRASTSIRSLRRRTRSALEPTLS